jgi:kinesin family protein 3/17
MEYMNLGNKNRSVGETAMNKDSSRSHLLFSLYLESAEITSG